MCVRAPVCVNTAESMQGPFREADLLAMLKKMLEDPIGTVEVKFSALGLICSLANSSMCSHLRHTFTENCVPLKMFQSLRNKNCNLRVSGMRYKSKYQEHLIQEDNIVES